MSMSCTACRLRRRQCDRREPRCSQCTNIQIPEKLCIYHKPNSDMLYKKPRVTLEKLRRENKRLFEQQLEAKIVYEKEFYRVHPISRKDKKQITVDRLDYLRREEAGSSLSYNGVVTALSSTGEAYTHEILQILKRRAVTFTESDKEKDDHERKDSKEAAEIEANFNEIMGLFIETLLGMRPLENRFIVMLLEEIISILPNYETSTLLLATFFHLNDDSFVRIDEKRTIENFHKFFAYNPENQKLQLKKFKESEIMEATGATSLLVVTIGYAIMCQSLVMQLPSSKAKSRPNYSLLFHYADMLNKTIFSTHFFKDSSPELLISDLHIRRCSSYSPYGDRERSDGYLQRHRIGMSLGVLKSFGLDKKIELQFSEFSESFRLCLRFINASNISDDIVESLECGFPPFLSAKEFPKIAQVSDPDIAKFLTTINRVLNKYFEYDTLLNPRRYAEFLENDLIYELQTSLYINVDSAENILDMWLNVDPETNYKVFNKYTYVPFKICCTLFAYSLIATLYNASANKIQIFKDQLPSSYVDENVKKYQLLALKYALTVFYINSGITRGLKRLFQHPAYTTNCFHYTSATFLLYSMMTTSLRRCGSIIGGIYFDRSENSKEQVFEEAKTYDLKNFQLDVSKYKDVLNIEFFELKDLEDRRIDRDTVKLFEKFESKLFNPRITVFSVYKLLLEYCENTENEKVDLSFLKDNFSFFYQFSLSLLMLRTICCNPKYFIDPKDNSGTKSNTNGNNIEENFSTNKGAIPASESSQRENTANVNTLSEGDSFDIPVSLASANALDFGSVIFDFQSMISIPDHNSFGRNELVTNDNHFSYMGPLNFENQEYFDTNDPGFVDYLKIFRE